MGNVYTFRMRAVIDSKTRTAKYTYTIEGTDFDDLANEYPEDFLILKVFAHGSMQDTLLAKLTNTTVEEIDRVRKHIAMEILIDNWRWYSDLEIAHISGVDVSFVTNERVMRSLSITFEDAVEDSETSYAHHKKAIIALMDASENRRNNRKRVTKFDSSS